MDVGQHQSCQHHLDDNIDSSREFSHNCLIEECHTFFNNTAMRFIISAEYDYFSSQVPSFHGCLKLEKED
jgi:hypothetical protein